jgi:AcrR family transcriptional regulator
MGCPTGKREHNRQKRRAAIVEVATRSFLEQGYAATSMSAIADELGGSKATLWSHFSSKEELFIAVVDEQVALFAAEMEEVLVDEPFSIQGLRRYCLRFLQTLMRPQSVGLFRVIMGDGGRFPEINNVFHVRGPAKLLSHLTEFMATRLAPEEARRVAMLTNAALAGWRAQMLTRPEALREGELEQFVDDFIAHLRLPEYERSP